MPRARFLLAALVLGTVLAAPDPGTSSRGCPGPATVPPPPRAMPTEAQLDAAINRGLQYLASTQHVNGCWNGDVGHKQMDSYLVYHTREMQDAANRGNVGVTALAGLAFLANGQVPHRGRWTRVVDHTTNYILDLAHDHHGAAGYIADSDTRMYEHAFATLFLSQVYGMSMVRHADVARQLKAAAALIVDCQNQTGGWRYGPYSAETDLSVTVCQVQALRAARDAGIAVPKACIERVLNYLARSRIESGPDRGCFYYKITGRGAFEKTSFSINAAAATALQSAGIYTEREYARALDFVLEEYDRVSRRTPDHFYFWYGNYYAAQAMRMAGGDRWAKYWPRIVDDLLTRQQSDGRWRNDTGPGDEFATAVACLILQIPRGWLPIFQK